VNVTPGQIAAVTLTIDGGSLVAPMLQNLTKVNENSYSGTVSFIPVGSGYTFLVQAWSAATPASVLYSGETTGVTIAEGQTAQVAVYLQQVDPTPELMLQVPVIAGLSASGTTIVPGTTVRVSVSAYSPVGNSLTYLWQSTCGTFASATQPATDWTSPVTAASCSLSVAVSDAVNGTSARAYLVVQPPPAGSAEIAASINTQPILTLTAVQHVVKSAGPPGLAVGITVDLVATLSDPDGDALRSTWQSACSGGTEPGTYGAATFTPSVNDAIVQFHHANPDARCTITISVTDGRGGWNQGVLQVSGPAAFASASGGERHTLAVRSDGTLWAWGFNGNGQLGDGTTVSRYSPVQIGSAFAAVAAGASHSLGLHDNGELWAWGENYYGQLGDGTTTASASPVLIGSGFAAIAAGAQHSLALRTDGTLWAWGHNAYGELGDDTYADHAAPAQIATGSTFASVAAGSNHGLAIRTDGTLWAWGRNDNGQIGDGTYNEAGVASPVLIGSGFSQASASGTHSAAVMADGTLWAWGYGGHGQLGDGTGVGRESPVLIGSGFVQVAAAAMHTAAVKTDGSMSATSPAAIAKYEPAVRPLRRTPPATYSAQRPDQRMHGDSEPEAWCSARAPRQGSGAAARGPAAPRARRRRPERCCTRRASAAVRGARRPG
jgi:hypothetical protein